MTRYIIRRVIISIFILLGASFIIYCLAAISKDPLEELRQSQDPNKEALIAGLIRSQHLDVPPPARYFIWLGGLLGIFWGKFTWGETMQGQDVGAQVANAVTQTMQLVLWATIIAIIVGVIVGMTTAIRQYSGYDYTVTFLAFLGFSLPAFVLAVLLKQYVAIDFNNFLAHPTIAAPVIVAIALVLGFLAQFVVGGTPKRRFTLFAMVAGFTAALLIVLNLLDWFNNPGLNWYFILLLGLMFAYVSIVLTTGVSNKRALYGALAMPVLTAIVWFSSKYYPVAYLVRSDVPFITLILIPLGFTLIGGLLGYFFGGDDRVPVSKAVALSGFMSGLLFVVDRAMQDWTYYFQYTNGRPIQTVGAQTPGLDASPWTALLDSFSHLLLPTMALSLLSIASYSRFSRASLLEVLGQDYVRTARAKGLGERTVILRHAFRNAMIPVATIVAMDFGGIIGGAIITEQIFGWRAMGTLFINSLNTVDMNPFMAVFIITSGATVLANLLADLLYSILDPRIRVS